MNESECRNADWYMIGIEDGINGSLPSRIGEHRQTCSKYNVTPNLNAYQNGHAEGIKQFCTESQGFANGKKGIRYKGVCPPGLEMAFLKGYRIGRNFYDLSNEIERAGGAISSYKNRIEKLEKNISKKEQLLVNDGTTVDDRRRLLDEIKKNQKEIGELEEKILDNEKHKAVKENEYSQLQNLYNY
ncbi:MAG: DUF2799 domain-containing protein [Desulfobulbaceae bacterium]|nr:DUF2799 domain-containing protein [Desulfobulbaceae bacterium]